MNQSIPNFLDENGDFKSSIPSSLSVPKHHVSGTFDVLKLIPLSKVPDDTKVEIEIRFGKITRKAFIDLRLNFE